MCDGMVRIFSSHLTTLKPFFLKPDLSPSTTFMSCLSSLVKVTKLKGIQSKTRLAKAFSNLNCLNLKKVYKKTYFINKY